MAVASNWLLEQARTTTSRGQGQTTTHDQTNVVTHGQIVTDDNEGTSESTTNHGEKTTTRTRSGTDTTIDTGGSNNTQTTTEDAGISVKLRIKLNGNQQNLLGGTSSPGLCPPLAQQ